MRPLVLLCVLAPFALAQEGPPDTLVVRITAEPTSGPFGGVEYGLRPGDPSERLGGVPDTLADLEHYEWAVTDSSGADAVASFVIGRDARFRHVLVADSDNDERLDDETPLVLPHYRLGPTRERAGREVPAVRVEIERGDGDRRWTEAAGLAINPYVNGPDGAPYERGGRPYYFAGARRHGWGLTPAGDTVYVAPDWWRGPLVGERMSVRFSGMGPDEEPYAVGDVAPLGGRAVRIGPGRGDEVWLVEAPDGVPEIGLRVGQRAPDFRARTEAGDSLRLADLRGRFVLLDFWGTWCGPCRMQTPALREAAAAYGDRLVVLGVADDDPAAVAAYVEEEGLGWAQVVEGRDRPKPVHDLYAVRQWPTTFLLDPDGRIVAKSLYADMAEQLAEHVGPPDGE